MIAITREYLDAFTERHADHDQDRHCDECGEAFPCDVLPPIAALRRVLDLCDDPSTMPDGQKVLTVQRVFDALAGTQTDDGAGAADSGLPTSDPMHGGARTVGAVANHRSASPAPSSPARCDCGHGWERHYYSMRRHGCDGIDGERCPCAIPQTDDGAGKEPAVTAVPAPSSPDRIEVLARALAYVDDQPQSVHLYRSMAQYGLRALDAYDREQREAVPWHDWAQQHAAVEADLRQRIAADIEADVLLSPFSGGREVNAYNHGARNAASHAARIARGGQS